MRASSAQFPRTRLPDQRGGACGGARRQFTAVYFAPGYVDRFEAEPLRSEFDGHKAAGLVGAGDVKRSVALQVSATRFSARAGGEILHALLWFSALVNMIVAREGRVHAVLDQKRLKLGAQMEVRPVLISRRVERVMEHCDLPFCLRRLKRLFQPTPLLKVEAIRVEPEEFHEPVAFGERIISAPAHVEVAVIGLRFPPFLDVVVAKHSVECDAASEQFRVWPLELGLYILRIAVGVNVVAQHQRRVVKLAPLMSHHHARQLMLGGVSFTRIAENDET